MADVLTGDASQLGLCHHNINIMDYDKHPYFLRMKINRILHVGDKIMRFIRSSLGAKIMKY